MDVEIWLYFMLPLFATIAGAIYVENTQSITGLAERVGHLEEQWSS